jgi:hypothetical protein
MRLSTTATVLAISLSWVTPNFAEDKKISVTESVSAETEVGNDFSTPILANINESGLTIADDGKQAIAALVTKAKEAVGQSPERRDEAMHNAAILGRHIVEVAKARNTRRVTGPIVAAATQGHFCPCWPFC